jgi:phage shock protein PspC (stress-responsive transcriptional regulator)
MGVFFAKISMVFAVLFIDVRLLFLYSEIMRKLYNIKNFIEWKAFGVCSAIGDRMGLATPRIRFWFIYISFLTMGSPVIVYMVLAFWMNLKQYTLQRRRNPLRWR